MKGFKILVNYYKLTILNSMKLLLFNQWLEDFKSYSLWKKPDYDGVGAFLHTLKRGIINE